MADNLSHLEDAAELRRRTLVPPPALFIRPPLGCIRKGNQSQGTEDRRRKSQARSE
jgi:hypothetical protein